MIPTGAGNAQGGMTLLELLIALAIFALVATASYMALGQGIQIQERLQGQRSFWQGLESGFALIGRDLEQARARSPRVPGGGATPAFHAPASLRATRKGTLIRLTRGGHSSFREGPVSPYLRVAYRLRDGVLVRVTWPRVDAPSSEEAASAVLLEGIEKAEVRFLVPGSQRWLEGWPPGSAAAVTGEAPAGKEAPGAGLPQAIELTLEMENHGRFRRLFHVGPPQ